MKYYVQMYQLGFDGEGKPYYEEALGSFGIVRLDGRMGQHNMALAAKDICEQRGYDGYRIGRGARLDRMFWMNAAVIAVSEVARAVVFSNVTSYGNETRQGRGSVGNEGTRDAALYKKQPKGGTSSALPHLSKHELPKVKVGIKPLRTIETSRTHAIDTTKREVFAVLWEDFVPLSLECPDEETCVAKAIAIRATGKVRNVRAVHLPAGQDELIDLLPRE